MNNFLKLYTGHLRSSKRVLFIASIGLICALTIVSSTNYYYDNSKNLLVENFFNPKNNGLRTQSDGYISLQAPLRSYNRSLQLVIQDINKTQNEYKYNYFKSIVVQPSLIGLNLKVNQSISANTSQKRLVDLSTRVIEPNSHVIHEVEQINRNSPLIKDSTLPSSSSLAPDIFILFVYNNSNPQFRPNYSLMLPKDKNVSLFDTFTRSPVNVHIDGMASVNLNDFVCGNVTCNRSPNYNDYPNLRSLNNPNGTGNEFHVLIFTSNMIQFSSWLDNVEKQVPYTLSNDNILYYGQTGIMFYVKINLDFTKIDPYSANKIGPNIYTFIQSISDKLTSNPNFQYVNSIFSSQSKFKDLTVKVDSLVLNLILVTVPVLISTIFVINFSFGVINKNIIQQFGIFRTRGITSWTLFYFQVIDNMLIIIFSIIMSLIAGIPLSALVIKTNFFLSFNTKFPNNFTLNLVSTGLLVTLFAVIIELLVNLKRIVKLSLITIVESENPIEKADPFWKRHNIDFLLFTIGLVLYVVFYVITRNPNIAVFLGPLKTILTIIILPAPFTLVIGIILLVNRIVPVILNKIGTFLWDKTGNLVAFSFKNVIRHKQASTRVVMLISILISFTIFFYSLPYSSIVNNQDNFFYEYGAEGNGQFSNAIYNATTLSIIQNKYSQYLTSFTPYIILRAIGSSSQQTFSLLLINTSTYLNTAYLNFNLGLSHNIKNDVSNLKISSSRNFTNLNVLSNERLINDRGASIGSNVTYTNPLATLRMHVIDSFTNWPILSHINLYGPTAIGDISFFLNIRHQSMLGTPLGIVQQHGILFKFKPGVNQALVASWIEGNTSISHINLEYNSQKQFISNVFFVLELGQINNDIIMILIISAIMLIMFAYLQINERKNEIFTERALGMKLYQIASLFFIETFILILTSIFLGLGVGLFLMELLGILLFNSLQQYPPYKLIFPSEIIIGTILLLLIISILTSVIPAIFVTKQDISKSFGEA